MMHDVLSILQWWTTLFLLGGLVFPLASLLFPQFLDRGYGLTKILGIVLLSYFVFLLGTLHLIPFTVFGLYAILLLFVAGLYFTLSSISSFSLKKLFLPYLKGNWKLLIFEEFLFLIVLVLWSMVRAHEPTLNGLEKFMDYGFINSILRSDYFPAKDMWLAPLSINYYYFGHLVTAVLTKLSFLPSYLTYNLMLASIAALCFSASFTFGSTLLSLATKSTHSLKKYIVAGLLTALLVTFAGNFHALYSLFEAYPNESPVPLWEVAFSPTTFPNNYWYPNATRFIYNTIHEFPIYSWVVSDLHGHVLDIPFVLLTLSVLLSFFLKYNDQPFSISTTRSQKSQNFLKRQLSRVRLDTVGYLLFISFLLSVQYMTNAWDGIIYLLLTGLLLLYITWQQVMKLRGEMIAKLMTIVVRLVTPVLILGVGFVIFSLPFSLFFKPFVSGIGILCAPSFLTNLGSIGPFLFEVDHCQRSPLWQLGILHGFFFIFITVFLVFLARAKKLLTSDVFVLLLILLSALLITIPEFAYMKDIYPAHYRANTMFKLVFQSFIMLSLCTGYIIVRVTNGLKEKNRALSLLFSFVAFLLVLPVLTYPYFAVMSYYGDLKTYHGLNGIKYLEDKYPADYEALLWLSENVKDQPVILEAQGDSYTDYARVSSNTGLPTVLGWTVHEWLWRGSYDIPSPRIEEIKVMYESDDLEQTKKLLKKYNVEYVFLGDLEREKYVELNVEKFEELGDVVFEKNQTMIYKLIQ